MLRRAETVVQPRDHGGHRGGGRRRLQRPEPLQLFGGGRPCRPHDDPGL